MATHQTVQSIRAAKRKEAKNHAQQQKTCFIRVHMVHVISSIIIIRKNHGSAQLQSKDAAFKPILYLQPQPFMPETDLRLPGSTRHCFFKLSAAITEHCASPTAEYRSRVVQCRNHQGKQPPSARWLETSFKTIHVHFQGKSRWLIVFDCLQLFPEDDRGSTRYLRKCNNRSRNVGAENATVKHFSDRAYHHLDIGKDVIEIATSLHEGFVTSSLLDLFINHSSDCFVAQKWSTTFDVVAVWSVAKCYLGRSLYAVLATVPLDIR